MSAYPFYRFSGIWALIAFVGTGLYLSSSVYALGELALLVVSDAVFGTLAYAKFVGFVLRPDKKSWWMMLVKLNVGLSAVIVFPIGILAWILHMCFVADRA